MADKKGCIKCTVLYSCKYARISKSYEIQQALYVQNTMFCIKWHQWWHRPWECSFHPNILALISSSISSRPICGVCKLINDKNKSIYYTPETTTLTESNILPDRHWSCPGLVVVDVGLTPSPAASRQKCGHFGETGGRRFLSAWQCKNMCMIWKWFWKTH
jgi:hypothetical protein